MTKDTFASTPGRAPPGLLVARFCVPEDRSPAQSLHRADGLDGSSACAASSGQRALWFSLRSFSSAGRRLGRAFG